LETSCDTWREKHEVPGEQSPTFSFSGPLVLSDHSSGGVQKSDKPALFNGEDITVNQFFKIQAGEESLPDQMTLAHA